MKRLISCFLFCLMAAAPLYAGTQTLTTYYPAPSGNYKKLQTSSMQLIATTLKSIQAEYNCSFDPADNLGPCPAGLMFYDTDDQMIYVSAGTHWRSVNSTCVPLVACSAILNCGKDSCGNLCGICINNTSCNNPTPTIPGSCV